MSLQVEAGVSGRPALKRPPRAMRNSHKRKRLSPADAPPPPGLYVHSSPPRVLHMNASQIRQWLRGGDLDRLEAVVLEGQGHKLVGEYSPDPKVRAFLKSVPSYMAKMEVVQEAAARGALEEVRALLEEDPRRRLALCKDAAGVSLLHKAVFNDHQELAQWLAETYPGTLSIRDREGRTALHYVGRCSQPQRTWEVLAAAGADTTVQDVRGRDAAYYVNHPRELQLPGGRSPSAPARRFTSGKDGFVVTRANIRIWIHDRDLLRLQQMLWEGHGDKLRMETSNHPRVKRLLDAVPYIMGTIREVHRAAVEGDGELLRQRSADPVPAAVLASKDANGLTPIMKAAGLGRAAMLGEMLARAPPSALEAADGGSRRALHWAAFYAARNDGPRQNGDGDACYRLLLQHGADAAAKDAAGNEAEHYLQAPRALDAALLRVIPDAPRTASVFPPAWDWRLLSGGGGDGASASATAAAGAGAPFGALLPGGGAAAAAAAAVAAAAGAAKVDVEGPEQNGDNEDDEEDEGVGEEGDHEEEAERQRLLEAEELEQRLKLEEEEAEKLRLEEAERMRIEEEEAERLKLEEEAERLRLDEEEAERLRLEEEEAERLRLEEEEAERLRLEEEEAERLRLEEEEAERLRLEEEEAERLRLEEEEAERLRLEAAALQEAEHQRNEVAEEDEEEGAAAAAAAAERWERDELLGAEAEAEAGAGAEDEEDDAEARALVADGDLEKLAGLVLAGEGHRLVGLSSDDPETQAFLANVPSYIAKISAVHAAARDGRLRELQAALDRRRFAVARDPSNALLCTPLHAAVLHARTDVVRYLAGRFPETLNAPDAHARSPLHYAAALADNGHLYNVLLNLGADPNLQDDRGRSAEYYLQHRDRISHKQLLAEYGSAESLADDTFGDQVRSRVEPVFWTEEGRYLAAALGDPLIKGLMEIADVRPSDPIAYLATYLYNFANKNKSRVGTQESAVLIAAPEPAPMPQADSRQQQPQEDEQQRLLQLQQAYLQRRPDRQEEQLEQQAQRADDERASSPDDPDSSATRDEHGQSMLHFAAARPHGRRALLQLLLETRLNVGWRDELYRTARDVAAQADLPDNMRDIDLWLVHLAAQGDTRALADLLLEGYDHLLDAEDDDGRSVRDVAHARAHSATLQLLDSAPAFEERRERLHAALRRGEVSAAAEVLATTGGGGSGAATLAAAKNVFGRCALHIAVLRQDVAAVELLATRFPNTLRVGDNLERTALHYAMGVEQVEQLSSVLIRAGAKRVLKDLKGRQPSYYFMNKSDILRLQEDEESLIN